MGRVHCGDRNFRCQEPVPTVQSPLPPGGSGCYRRAVAGRVESLGQELRQLFLETLGGELAAPQTNRSVAGAATGSTIPFGTGHTFAPDWRPFWTAGPGFINQVFGGPIKLPAANIGRNESKPAFVWSKSSQSLVRVVAIHRERSIWIGGNGEEHRASTPLAQECGQGFT
jgi:hypothetical protein